MFDFRNKQRNQSTNKYDESMNKYRNKDVVRIVVNDVPVLLHRNRNDKCRNIEITNKYSLVGFYNKRRFLFLFLF